MQRMLRLSLFAFGLAALTASPVAAALPPGFTDQLAVGGWDLAVGARFAPDGRMFVWEKGGRVWTVVNGVRDPQPLIDLREEVGNWRDFGLLGFAIDPDFYDNGYIYLLYVVDYHHLVYYGTPDYDPQADQYYTDTIGRLTRYTANGSDGFHSVDYNSRTILVGESITSGFPICHQSHGIGTLQFGEDGSLIAGCGDGASYATTDTGGWMFGSSNTALTDGIITPKEDVGAYRSQLVDSLSGKILRLNPVTGDGLPDNPFYDAGAPRAPRSRIWALGLRNPFRFCVRPGSGSTSTPGTLYIGDVGWSTREELDVCKSAGANFGWPAFEGMTLMNSYWNAATANLDAPNPLFGQGGCTQEYFTFQNLIIQETLDPNPSFPNPCDAGQQIPASIPRFVHKRPAIDWHHSTGPSRCSYFIGQNPAFINLDDPQSPVPGPRFGGFSSTGGTWYASSEFPAEYHDTYFQADFVSGWIRNFVFDAADNAVLVRDFAPNATGAIVCLAVNPVNGQLHYVAYSEGGESQVRRIVYTPPCFADLNDDMLVDLLDLSLLLTNFGALSGMHYADGDLDADGDVDLIDLSSLLVRFGDECP